MGEEVRCLPLAVIDLARDLARQVLPEGAAEIDVEQLEAAADPPDRQPALAGEVHEVPFELVPFRAHLDLGVREDRLAVTGGIDVDPAGEDEALGLGGEVTKGEVRERGQHLDLRPGTPREVRAST